MTRLSGDELHDGLVWTGFDDAVQVWVLDGLGQACGHPPTTAWGGPCCAAFARAGRRIDEIPGAPRRGGAADPSAASDVTDPDVRPTEA